MDAGGPAFPTGLENRGLETMRGFDGEDIRPGRASVYPGMSLRAYLAAHAPPVPSDFAPLHKTRVVTSCDGLKQILPCLEAQADTLVRWRLHYADMMIEALK